MTTNDLEAVLTCRIGEQLYALAIPDVVEVAAMVALITLPEPHPVVVGVANRHGEVLPMLDLRRVFGTADAPIDASTLFVVVQHDDGLVGLIVDEIQRVAYLPPEKSAAAAAGRYIRGIISYENNLIQLIALQPLLDTYLPDEVLDQEILKVETDE